MKMIMLILNLIAGILQVAYIICFEIPVRLIILSLSLFQLGCSGVLLFGIIAVLFMLLSLL